MTKMQVIARLWSSIYDLLFTIRGRPTKSLEQIEEELKITEKYCEKYTE